jgi:hypothetical protein
VPAPGPFVYTWSDRTPGQVYQLTITVTDTNGCNEVHLKYIQDEAPAPCAFPNVTTVPNPSATTGSIVTLSNTFVVPNNGTDPIQFQALTAPVGPFLGSIKITWADPRVPPVIPTTLIAAAVVWSTPSPVYNNTDNFAIATSPITRNAPATMPATPAGGTFSLTVRFTYKKTETAIITSPIQKLCLAYRIVSEPGVTKFCNLVGQSAKTNNPNSCD